MSELKFISDCQKTVTKDLKYLNERDIQDGLELLRESEEMILQLSKSNVEQNNSMNKTLDNLVSIFSKMTLMKRIL